MTTNQCFHFYVIFVNDYLRFTWLYPLKWQSEFFVCFHKFQNLVENQFDRKIKVFQCDGGGEFSFNIFFEHLRNNGIKLHVSCHRTSQQKVVEQKHWHIVETKLIMFFHANLPSSLWVEVFLTVVYLTNRLPSSTLNNVNPYFKFYGRHFDYIGLWVQGC